MKQSTSTSVVAPSSTPNNDLSPLNEYRFSNTTRIITRKCSITSTASPRNRKGFPKPHRLTNRRNSTASTAASSHTSFNSNGSFNHLESSTQTRIPSQICIDTISEGEGTSQDRRKRGFIFKMSKLSLRKLSSSARSSLQSKKMKVILRKNQPDDLSIESNTEEKYQHYTQGLQIGSSEDDQEPQEQELSSSKHDQDHTRDARVRYNLGLLNIANGDLAKALCNIDISLRARKMTYGDQHESVASAHEKMGDIAVEMQKHREVDLHYDSALKILLPTEDRNTMKCASNILLKKADYLLQDDHVEPALECFALAIPFMKLLVVDEDDKAVTDILHKMGHLFLRIEDSENGLKCFTDALASNNAAQDHSTLQTIGLLYLNKGDYDNAMSYFKAALMIINTSSESSSKDAFTLLQHIGFIHFSGSKYDCALQCFEDALSGMKQNPFDFETTLAVCNYIVDIHKRRGHIGKVIDCYKELISRATTGMIQSPEKLRNVIHKLGNVYEKLDKHDEAIQCFKDEIQLLHDPKKIALLLIRIGTCYRDNCNYANALSYYEAAIQNLTLPICDGPDGSIAIEAKNYTFEKRLEKCEDILEMNGKLENDRNNAKRYAWRNEVADVLNDMGNLYATQESYTKAIACYETSGRLRPIEKSKDQQVLRTKFNMGWIMYKMNYYDKSKQCLEEVLSDQRVECGHHHEDVANTLTILARVCTKRNDNTSAIQYHQEAIRVRTLDLGKENPMVQWLDTL